MSVSVDDLPPDLTEVETTVTIVGLVSSTLFVEDLSSFRRSQVKVKRLASDQDYHTGLSTTHAQPGVLEGFTAL